MHDDMLGRVRRCTDPKEKPRRLNKTKLVLWYQMLSAPLNTSEVAVRGLESEYLDQEEILISVTSDSAA